MPTNVDYPYSPSWLNRLTAWIVSLPGPAWFYYLLGLVLVALFSRGIGWIVGVNLNEADEIRVIVYSIYPVYFVALTHFLDGQALAALAKFRQVLPIDEASYQRLAYRLTTIPARGAWIATTLALLPGAVVTLTDPSDPFIRSGNSFAIGLTVGVTMFTVACVFIFAYHTIRQLRMIDQIHRLATKINPYHAGPLYAFSELTSRTGIGLIFFAYFIVLVSGPDPYSLILYVILASIALVAIAAFVLPLLGMHQRLKQEKAKLQTEINHGIEVAHQELQERVQTRNFVGVDDLDKVLSSLLSLREVAAKLSTWPWQAETLRGFVSALLLPVLIWVLTTLLERFLAL